MRVVWLTRFGGPEVLVPGEAPDPEPGPGQVLVDVRYAGITFVETQARAGAMNPFGTSPPVVPGNGVGGLVAAVGSGVDPDLVGTRVVTSTGGSGGYAEKVVVPADAPIPVPPRPHARRGRRAARRRPHRRRARRHRVPRDPRQDAAGDRVTRHRLRATPPTKV